MTTTLRAKVVEQAKYVVAHGANWRYYEIRPVPVDQIKAWMGKSEIQTDCSGSCIGIFARAGAPDPSGNGYNGAGNTNSFFSHLEHLPKYTDAEPGDLIDVGNASGTDHVYLVISKTADDMQVFSHGGPLGKPPVIESLNAVKGYWYSTGHTFTGLRALAATPTAPHWVILNGRGTKIGETDHPVVWATNHPKMFRTYGQVRFNQTS